MGPTRWSTGLTVAVATLVELATIPLVGTLRIPRACAPKQRGRAHAASRGRAMRHLHLLACIGNLLLGACPTQLQLTQLRSLKCDEVAKQGSFTSPINTTCCGSAAARRSSSSSSGGCCGSGSTSTGTTTGSARWRNLLTIFAQLSAQHVQS